VSENTPINNVNPQEAPYQAPAYQPPVYQAPSAPYTPPVNYQAPYVPVGYPAPQQPTQKKRTVGEVISCILGMLTGVLSIIFAFGTDYYGRYTYQETYGGDAYTGIQNAAADTANNINSLGWNISDNFRYLLIVIGLALIAYFSLKLFARRK
jgi:hypothetical protein